MPKNKSALIRYRVLDRCFRNRHRRYYIEDLIDACNEELQEYNGSSVKKRQIQDDMAFMESCAGYEIDLERCRDGHRVYYRYRDPDYSIMNLPLTQDEAEQLSETIQMLSRFKGLPQFTWMDEVFVRLKDSFQLDDSMSGSVSFAQNPDLKGIEYFSPLFDAIVSKQVLAINYTKFGKSCRERILHPYQLRQYNNRWFLVGLEERLLPRIPLAVLPIDRISGFKLLQDIVYQDYNGIDFDEYFYDVVGVSINPESLPVKVVARVVTPAADYIQTKPIHPSQCVLEQGDDYVILQWTVIINYELETQLLSYADQCEILEPKILRESLHNRAEKIAMLNS